MRTGCLPIRAVEGKKYLTLAEAVESETRPICVFVRDQMKNGPVAHYFLFGAYSLKYVPVHQPSDKKSDTFG